MQKAEPTTAFVPFGTWPIGKNGTVLKKLYMFICENLRNQILNIKSFQNMKSSQESNYADYYWLLSQQKIWTYNLKVMLSVITKLIKCITNHKNMSIRRTGYGLSRYDLLWIQGLIPSIENNQISGLFSLLDIFRSEVHRFQRSWSS